MRRIIPAVAAGVTALAVAGGTFGYVTLDKAVSLSIDGQVQPVQTMAGTVGDLLADRGIAVGDRDLLSPAPETRLGEGTEIAVRYGRVVTLTVDGARQTLWTTETSVDRAIDELGIDTSGADIVPGLSTTVGRDGLAVTIATAKTVTVQLAGKDRTVTTTAPTVAGALTAAKIKVDGDDLLSVKPAAPLVDGAKFRYTRVTVSTATSKKDVPFKTVRKNTAKLERGDTEVDTRGVEGVRTTTYRVVRHDGKTVTRKQTSSKVTRKPVARVILVGTKPKPEPKAEESSGGGSTPSASVGSGSVWDRLAKCESGGNWSINTGNGYYGGLQFSAATWRAYGGSGLPHQNSRAQQIAIAQKLQAAAGWGQWPSCSSKLGLR